MRENASHEDPSLSLILSTRTKYRVTISCGVLSKQGAVFDLPLARMKTSKRKNKQTSMPEHLPRFDVSVRVWFYQIAMLCSSSSPVVPGSRQLDRNLPGFALLELRKQRALSLLAMGAEHTQGRGSQNTSAGQQTGTWKCVLRQINLLLPINPSVDLPPLRPTTTAAAASAAAAAETAPGTTLKWHPMYRYRKCGKQVPGESSWRGLGSAAAGGHRAV